MARRRIVGIEVYGPTRDAPAGMDCRRCGGRARVWSITGVGDRLPHFWECVDCGLAEVVVGTPMHFGELPNPGYDHRPRYQEYRRGAGLQELL